jgi:hypothetical protein
LAHLARHARADALPPYLRTCQCHEHGCRWHPRHRGCAGPVLLVLSSLHGGRTWRLADICAACAGSTARAAVVPDTTLSSCGKGQPVSRPTRKEVREQVRVLLLRLQDTMPAGTGAEALLLAVQCALRANNQGRTYLPAGLLRGMGLHHAPSPWTDLEQAHWLQRIPTVRGVLTQLLDPATLSPAESRPRRLNAADWALRVCYTATSRRSSPQERLSVLNHAARRTFAV